ncbi:MAG: major capsid protein [Nevskia sp.]|jgi:hypothetical protein|nr:major capsid protein [Nevskia sp.]MCK9385059.1 major capsid protein [Nevskia sp.]
MPQLTPAQARVVDPVLTTYAQGYSDPEFVGFYLFPSVPVNAAGGQIIEFGKESFRQYNTQRAPGGSIKRAQTGYLGRPFSLQNHAFAGTVPLENLRDAKQIPGVDLGKRAIRSALSVVQRSLEIQQAATALNAAAYDTNHKVALTGTGKWSDPTAKPITQISTYREAVRASSGRYPNVATFSAVAWQAFINNPEVIDRIKYTQTGIITEQLAAVLLQVEKVVVGKSIYADSNDAFVDIWGNNCVLAYTALGSKDAEEPSYGYTYTLQGHPAVTQPWWDNDTGSWIYPALYERIPVLSGISAGFLIQNPQ